MNEELTKELNAIQEKFNKEIEDVKKKYDKPMFEVGKWYKINSERHTGLFNITKYYNEIITAYGFGGDDMEWYNECEGWAYYDYNYVVLATPEEVEAALTNEAVKRGFKEGVRFKTPCSNTEYIAKGNIIIWQNGNTFGLRLSDSYGLILDNGKWAEIIKENTLDEIANKLSYTTAADIKHKLLKYKEEIINALNKL